MALPRSILKYACPQASSRTHNQIQESVPPVQETRVFARGPNRWVVVSSPHLRFLSGGRHLPLARNATAVIAEQPPPPATAGALPAALGALPSSLAAGRPPAAGCARDLRLRPPVASGRRLPPATAAAAVTAPWCTFHWDSPLVLFAALCRSSARVQKASARAVLPGRRLA